MNIQIKSYLRIPTFGLALSTLLTAAFVPDPACGQETLHSFQGTQGPDISLMQGNDGNFYGTTAGSATTGFGTVFKMTPDEVLTTLVSFANTNGSSPQGGLVQASDGNFYGTTYSGGNLALGGGAGLGTVFRMTPAGVVTTLVSFNAANGGVPYAGLVQGTNGDFYGTTYWGGNLALGGGSGLGTVFKITPRQQNLWAVCGSGSFPNV